MTVYFIGAGPGDPELITVKGQRLIHSCPVILYAGSLVPEAVLQGHRAEQVINTAELHLGEIVELLRLAHERGQDVARVHSGDPSLYGAIGEQIRELRRLGIPFEIVPGVTAAAACAALLESELTLPGIAGLILTFAVAVDANVLIYERMRDEARTGRSVIASMDAGFSKAWGTILDANVTTLVAAAIMFVFGAGPVRGFAWTLSIGVFTSVFSSVLVAQVLLAYWLKTAKPKKLPIAE